MKVVAIDQGRGAICREILADLPNWFGIPKAVDQYVRDAEVMPMYGMNIESSIAGFVVVRHHSRHTAEIHVIGVRRAFHRCGIGRALIEHVVQILRKKAVEFLTVKTLSASASSEHYDKTREFYTAIGFRVLEEFPTLWDAKNPCLMMIKAL